MEIFQGGGLEAEAQRVNDSTALVLKQAGLDPTIFGVSMPESYG
jgi:hypothetical protein